MKIAFLSDGAYAYASGRSDAVGGAERDQWLLARALAEAGWSATVGVRDYLQLGERKVIDGVEYVGIGRNQILLAWDRFLTSQQPDWLFWECAYHLWGPLVEIAKLHRIKTIFHAAFDTDFMPRKALSFRRQLWPLYAWGLSRTDRIFVQHEGQLSGLHPRWRRKAYVLPKICVFSEQATGLAPVTKSHAAREKYVAWVAMLRKHKRPDILVEIARRAPEIRFVVCGGITTHATPLGFGERIVNALRALPNVDYRGQVGPDEAMRVIAAASIFLSTSDEEGFPNTFTQAWSSGTPVISLKIDPGGLIVENGLGIIAGTADRAIAEIKKLIDLPEHRQEIAVRARQHINGNNSADAVVRLLEDALKNN